MESLIHKTLEDYRYAKRMENNKFKIFQPNQYEYDGDIIDNLNIGTLTKPQFGKFIDFIRAINTVSNSMEDLSCPSCEVSLQAVKEDLMKARLAYDNLPVIYDKDGNEIQKPNRDLLTLKIGNKDEVDSYYRNELDGQFDEKGNPLDKERYIYAGLLSNCDNFVENVVLDTFVNYLSEVDKATGNSFAEEVPTQFEIYPHGIHNENCFNENGNLIVHSYRVYDIIHNHEKGMEFEPNEFNMENSVLEDDLVSNKDFDIESDYYLVGRRIYEERVALEDEHKKKIEEQENSTHSVPIMQTEEVVLNPVKNIDTPTKTVQQKPVPILQTNSSANRTVYINGKFVDSNDEQANSLKKGDVLEHKTFGTGVFQEFNERGFMVIQFENDNEPKLVVPRAFSMGIIKKSEKKKAVVPNEISQAEALIENKTKPLLYNSSVKENVNEEHLEVIEAVQEHKESMASVTNADIIMPKPMFTEEDIEKTGIVVPVIEPVNEVQTQDVKSLDTSLVVEEKPKVAEKDNKVVEDIVKPVNEPVSVKESVPVEKSVNSETVVENSVASNVEAVTVPQHEFKNGRIVVRVFADRMVENKLNGVSLFDEQSRWVNFRMAYGKYKGYTFGVPDYFVSDSLPVGKDRNVATKSIAFYADWKRVTFTHPTKKDLRIDVPFKEALKLIEADMSPKTSTVSLVPKRPMMYNRNRGNDGNSMN